MLRSAGLPTHVPVDPGRSGGGSGGSGSNKTKLNEEALSPAQITAAENETMFFMNRRHLSHQLRSGGGGGGGGGGGSLTSSSGDFSPGYHGVTFERSFSVDSTVSDVVSSQMYEENYRDFKASILREERREFAAKVCVF